MSKPESFRVIVTGDRNWSCGELAMKVVARLKARYGPGLVVVHGACEGVDQSFDMACIHQRVAKEPHPAREHGTWPSCGPKRNSFMVKLGADLCLAVHRDINASKGTRDCARKALATGIPAWLIDGEDAEPKRLREGDARLQR